MGLKVQTILELLAPPENRQQAYREAYSPSCLELAFSHYATEHTASAKESINAPETFYGSVCASNPKNDPYLPRDPNRRFGLLLRPGGAEDTLPKDAVSRRSA